MRMTLSEIAASLQVSPATVSIVRSGKPGVSPFTRRRIQMKLEENGYSYKEYIVPGSDMPPSQQPGWLKKQIRLLKFFHSSLLTDKNDGFVDAIIDAVGAYARAAGYAILFSSVSQEDYSDVLAQLRGDTCDGLLVLATEMSREEIMQLAALPMPVVILDSDHPGLPFSCVTMDNRDIAYQAMMHLISLGTRDIGYLRSTIRTGNFVSRENGYIEALRAEHIAPDPALIVQPYAQPDRRVPGYGRMPAGGAARAPGPVCGQRHSGHWRHAGALRAGIARTGGCIHHRCGQHPAVAGFLPHPEQHADIPLLPGADGHFHPASSDRCPRQRTLSSAGVRAPDDPQLHRWRGITTLRMYTRFIRKEGFRHVSGKNESRHLQL